MKVQKKVIVVTGGGNGMGRQLVLNLLSKGAKVAAVDINEMALQETFMLAGDRQHQLSTHVVDITDRKAVEQLRDTLIDKFGHVDGIINNAGIIQPFKKLDVLDFETIERVMNINFYGMINMTKMFLTHLTSRPEAHIVNISSMGGFLPVPGQTVYGASKAAVKIISEGLASELSDTNVKVTTVFPGAIYTNIKANSGLGAEAGAGADESKAGAALSPAIAAQKIVKGMENDKRRLFVGKDSITMNLIYSLFPSLATKMIYKQIKHKI